MGFAVPLIMLCAVVFFVIFAAKSKAHFEPKPLSLNPEAQQDELVDETACLCELDQ